MVWSGQCCCFCFTSSSSSGGGKRRDKECLTRHFESERRTTGRSLVVAFRSQHPKLSHTRTVSREQSRRDRMERSKKSKGKCESKNGSWRNEKSVLSSKQEGVVVLVRRPRLPTMAQWADVEAIMLISTSKERKSLVRRLYRQAGMQSDEEKEWEGRVSQWFR